MTARTQRRTHVVGDQRLGAGGEVLVDRRCGATTGTHRQNDGGSAGDDVAASEHARQRRGLSDGVGGDIAAAVEAQPGCVASDDRVRVGAQRHDHRVALDLERLAGAERCAPTPFVWFAQFHPLDADAAHQPFGVGKHLERVVQEHELDAFVLGVVQLLGASGCLGPATAIHTAHLGAESLGDAQTVHRGVPCADHHDVFADAHGRVDIGETVAAHQVHASEELVGADDPTGVLARNAEECRCTGTDAQEHGVVALVVEQLLHRERAPDDLVGLELDAHLRQTGHFAIDDLPRQAERGDAISQHATSDVQRLVHRDVDTGAGQIGCTGETGRAGTDDSHPLAGGRGDCLVATDAVVTDETFETADGHRLHLAPDHALCFTLRFLRADTAAHRRKDVRFVDHIERSVDIAHQQVTDEARNVDGDRAAFDARGSAALQTTFGLAHRLGE
ncbi:unannotated protein [freshwater metagenome]|uniref:Unannotated protein n=1 Tax=freshwater metagenome TaxID=449393 RepID=A0A6J7AVF7_9ZZZZ